MIEPFSPGWLRCGHLQTLVGIIARPQPHPTFRRERWETPDDKLDFVYMDFIDGPPGTPWVHLFHGLEGSSDAPYSRRLMQLVKERGWRGSVLNFRSCGYAKDEAPNTRPRAYHAGDWPEAEWVLARVKALAGEAPVYAAGVSLGASVLLDWLGERGTQAGATVARAASVSAPVDLVALGTALDKGLATLYGRVFLGTLRPKALAKLAAKPDLFDEKRFAEVRTLKGFDDVVTGPIHGFADGHDYYTKASAKPRLRDIRVPTLLLNARDDPFHPATSLPAPNEVSSFVTLEFPDHGGHVGFVSGITGHAGWMPHRLIHFFEQGE